MVFMEENSNRLNTGIFGLDSMLNGGILKGSQVLIAGCPGSGKTLLAFEIIYKNAILGIPGLIFLFEERVKDFIENVKNAFSEFKDIDTLIEKKLIKIVNIDILLNINNSEDNNMIITFRNIINHISEEIKENNPKCVVIDSISLLKFIASNENLLLYRKSLFSLISTLRNYDITGIFTIDNSSISRETLIFQPEFYIFDGVIMLYSSILDIRRELSLEILKMRGSAHSKTVASYAITKRGFSVLANDVVIL
jgi:circadian clock protein KaiC